MGVRYGICSSKVDKHKLSINMLVGNLERSFTFFFSKRKKKKTSTLKNREEGINSIPSLLEF